MRNPGNVARLKHPGRLAFSCGMFGACAESILSPTTTQNTTTPPMDLAKSERATTAVQSLTQWQLPITRERTKKPAATDEERSGGGADEAVRLSVSTTDGTLEHFQTPEILRDAVSNGRLGAQMLKTVARLAQGCERNREVLFHAGVADGLVSILLDGLGAPDFCVEALSVLLALSRSPKMLQVFVDEQRMLDLAAFSLNSTAPAGVRLNALLLLEKTLVFQPSGGHVGAKGLMEGLVRSLRDYQKLTIKALLALCLTEQNRGEAVRAGAVDAILELLPNLKEVCAERALATLDLLCTVSEGRRALRDHALAVPLLLDMILKVSNRGTEYAVSALCAICVHEDGSVDARESAIQSGAFTQLLLLLQSDCTSRAKRKALQLLKVLHKVWGEGSCSIPDENCIFSSPDSDNDELKQ